MADFYSSLQTFIIYFTSNITPVKGILDLTLLTADLASVVDTGILHLSLTLLLLPTLEVSVVLSVSRLECSRAWALLSVQPRVRCGVSAFCPLDHLWVSLLKKIAGISCAEIAHPVGPHA